MNTLVFASQIDAAYRNSCSTAYQYPFNVEWTWCADIAIAMVCKIYMHEQNAIQETVKNALAEWKNNFTSMRDLITAINYLTWYAYEDDNFRPLTAELSDLYYKALDVAEKNLKKDETNELFRILD